MIFNEMKLNWSWSQIRSLDEIDVILDLTRHEFWINIILGYNELLLVSLLVYKYDTIKIN